MTEHLDMQTLSAYLDDALAPAEQARAAGHLTGCERCRATLAELRMLSRGLQALPCAALPAELQAKLESRFAPPPAAGLWRRRWKPIASAAASILLGLLIGSALQESPRALPGAYPLLAALGSTPPGALCVHPQSCYLKAEPK